MTLHTPFRQKNWPAAPEILTRQAVWWQKVLATERFALGGAIFFAIIIPEAFHPWLMSLTGKPTPVLLQHIEVSLVGSIVAILVGHSSLSRFTSLPTIDAKIYIVPAFLMTYAGVLAGFYLTNIPFGRYHFATSFVIAITWYFAITVARARVLKRRVAVIGDCVRPLSALIKNIEWLPLTLPTLTDQVSAIVVCRDEPLEPVWEHFIAQAVLQGVPVHESHHMIEVLTGRVELSHMMENSFGSLLPSLFYMRLKRPLDFLSAVLALVVVVPVILCCCVLIRMDSPGPAIYRQPRTGFRGMTFNCYKLRTMHINHGGPHFTAVHDERITRVGRFLRLHHIDELPQIFNILKGDMSWIGPRPEAVELAEAYEAAIPFYIYRHAVRPGISGWAAVHQGNVAEIDAATVKLEHDFFYIKYCSPWLDSLVALKTIHAMLTSAGSR